MGSVARKWSSAGKFSASTGRAHTAKERGGGRGERSERREREREGERERETAEDEKRRTSVSKTPPQVQAGHALHVLLFVGKRHGSSRAQEVLLFFGLQQQRGSKDMGHSGWEEEEEEEEEEIRGNTDETNGAQNANEQTCSEGRPPLKGPPAHQTRPAASAACSGWSRLQRGPGRWTHRSHERGREGDKR